MVVIVVVAIVVVNVEGDVATADGDVVAVASASTVEAVDAVGTVNAGLVADAGAAEIVASAAGMVDTAVGAPPTAVGPDREHPDAVTATITNDAAAIER